MTTAYLLSPCRGHNGNLVSAEEKEANVRRAIEIANTIRAKFPDLYLYCPHESEIIVDELWRGGVSSDRIIAACCRIAARMDIGIVYEKYGISEGMASEMGTMKANNKPLVYVFEMDDSDFAEIARAIWEVQGE